MCSIYTTTVHNLKESEVSTALVLRSQVLTEVTLCHGLVFPDASKQCKVEVSPRPLNMHTQHSALTWGNSTVTAQNHIPVNLNSQFEESLRGNCIMMHFTVCTLHQICIIIIIVVVIIIIIIILTFILIFTSFIQSIHSYVPRQTMSLVDTLLQLLFRFIVNTLYGAYLPRSYVGSDGLLCQHFPQNVCNA